MPISRALPRNSPRVRPIDARVPKVIASTVAAGAMIRLFFSARSHSLAVKKSWYHCSEKPCSG
ncbi:hypothetical protein D3C81_2309440 [compost metagenome]